MINPIRNLQNSLAGLKAAWTDKSFKAQVILGITLLPLAVVRTDVSLYAKIIVIVTYLVLLGFELLNTAIERLCDLITLERDLKIKRIKDISSAAVFLVLLAFLAQVIIIMSGIHKI